jgi:hypothetical protein
VNAVPDLIFKCRPNLRHAKSLLSRSISPVGADPNFDGGVRNWDIHSRSKCLLFDRRSATIHHHRGGLSRQEAHREIRIIYICGSGSIVVADFGGRTGICLRGARRSLYRQCSGLCAAGTRKRRAALCGTGCFIRRAGLWGIRLRGTRLRGTWTGVRSPRLRRTAARVCTGLWGTGACLRSSRLLWVRRTGARRTASLCRARTRLPIRLCGRIRAEATCRHPLQWWRSLHRQSRLRSVGILQLRHRQASAKGRLKHEPPGYCASETAARCMSRAPRRTGPGLTSLAIPAEKAPLRQAVK